MHTIPHERPRALDGAERVDTLCDIFDPKSDTAIAHVCRGADGRVYLAHAAPEDEAGGPVGPHVGPRVGFDEAADLAQQILANARQAPGIAVQLALAFLGGTCIAQRRHEAARTAPEIISGRELAA